MGWEATRQLRLYPKDGRLEHVDIESIVWHIENTARSLSSEVIYAINDAQNCFELKFNSSKLSGDIIIDTNLIRCWDILSYEEGGTLIGEVTQDLSSYNVALFAFDEVAIIGEQAKLKDFYDEFIPIFNRASLKKKFVRSNTGMRIIMAGYYSATNQHDTGNSSRRAKTKEKSKLIRLEEFREIYPVNDLFVDVIPRAGKIHLEKLNNYFNQLETVNDYEGLKSILFFYKNRLVKSVKWTEWEDEFTNKSGAYWSFHSADSWQNCINPNWIEFRNEQHLQHPRNQK